MELTRRRFLQSAAAVGGTAATVQFGGHLLEPVTAQSDRSSGHDEKTVPNVCLQCPAGCGIVARVVNGRVVKIDGNPDHPINMGKLCPKGQAGVEFLYDPDRIKGPLKRVGKRGGGQWKRISWDEAIDEVAAKLTELRTPELAKTVVVMSGRNRGHAGDLIDRWCNAYGTPNHVGHSSICEDGGQIGHLAMQGVRGYLGYDWDNTNYALVFGGGFTEAWRPTTLLLRAYGHMRRGRPQRAKIVVVDTRLSMSAAKADEWIPILPGTDAALALGMAHVLIKEGLLNQQFLAEKTVGFPEWAELVERSYAPEKMADVCGVPAKTIERLAREFGETQPAISAGCRGNSMQSNGIYNRMAIHALNGLVGSIDVPGGVITQHGPKFAVSGGDWAKDVKKDAVSSLKNPRVDEAGTPKFPLAKKVYQHIPDVILEGKPYPVNLLFTYYTNPMFSTPDAARWRKAIEKVPFLVSFSPFMDDTTTHADVVLPDHTYLERWQDDIIYPSLGYPVVGLRQPVVKPLFDTRGALDVLIELAQKTGGTMAESFPWKSFKALIQERYATIPGFSWADFEEKGYAAWPPYHFGDWAKTVGKDSATGKFEFVSATMEHKLEEAKVVDPATKQMLPDVRTALKLEAEGEEIFMPHLELPRYAGDPDEYPLLLNTYKTMAHAEGRAGNVPLLQEVMGLMVNRSWDSWVEVNPADARRLGIEDDDDVWVTSEVGRIKTKAAVFPGAQPGVVNMPFEFGHTAYGRWAKDRGVNPNEILVAEYDYLGGLAACFSPRGRVEKA